MAASPIVHSCGCLEVYSLAPSGLEMRRLRASILGHVGNHLRRSQAAVPRLPLAIAIFANGAKGHSALQLSRDLCCQYKTAFVIAHKLREAIETDQRKATFANESRKGNRRRIFRRPSEA